jgi:nitrite reductase/ring-hydroxylating ferredoxin subunit
MLIRRSDLPAGLNALDVEIDGEITSIILDCDRSPLRAWLNCCPHQGRRLDYAPGKFLIHKGELVCAAHGASFELSEGLCVGGPCRGEHLTRVFVEEEPGGGLRFRRDESLSRGTSG